METFRGRNTTRTLQVMPSEHMNHYDLCLLSLDGEILIIGIYVSYFDNQRNSCTIKIILYLKKRTIHETTVLYRALLDLIQFQLTEILRFLLSSFC